MKEIYLTYYQVFDFRSQRNFLHFIFYDQQKSNIGFVGFFIGRLLTIDS